MIITRIAYQEDIDQTRIEAEYSARIYACHWAGRVSEGEVRKAVKSEGLKMMPWSQTTKRYVLGRSRRLRTWSIAKYAS